MAHTHEVQTSVYALLYRHNTEHLEATIQALDRLPCHDEHFHTLGLEWRNRTLCLLGKQRANDPWTPVPIETAKAEGLDLTLFVDRDTCTRPCRLA